MDNPWLKTGLGKQDLSYWWFLFFSHFFCWIWKWFGYGSKILNSDMDPASGNQVQNFENQIQDPDPVEN